MPPQTYWKVLRLLHLDEAVSGEEMAKELRVSRVAVWKAVEKLRRKGVKVRADRRGYLLLELPDLISPEEVCSGMQGRRVGRTLVLEEEVTSTQDVARALAEGTLQDGTVVLAESQTSGRGRMGRRWTSDRGGLWFTVALRPKAAPEMLQAFSYMASLSVMEAIASTCNCAPWLKWPNDVFVGGMKVCGILAEAAASTDEIRYVLLGVGVNVNNELGPLGADGKAASLRGIAGAKVDRSALLLAILKGIDDRYSEAMERGFADVISDYRRTCATIGKRVRVELAGTSFEGVAEGIDPAGALEVSVGPKLVRVHAGDVIHLRSSL